MKNIAFIADDYGMSPGIDRAILDLLDKGRLTGTGCMTLFDDWEHEADSLRDHVARNVVGLHLTLTDQPALTGISILAPEGVLPSLPALAGMSAIGRRAEAAIHLELDAQLDRFTQVFGRLPSFIDGHQHVHFLPPVRRWLGRSAAIWAEARPWLRGPPGRPAGTASTRAKVGFVRAIAWGFAPRMRKRGFHVRGPLGGFYDWSRSKPRFDEAVEAGIRDLPDGAIFMCHPGFVDDTLRRRDVLTDAREAEQQFLSSDRFTRSLDATDARISVA